MIIMKTPKGWTGPKYLAGPKIEGSGDKIEGNALSHQVVGKETKTDKSQLKMVEKWLHSYKFAELDETFDWKINEDIFSLIKGNNSRGAKFTIKEDTLTMDFTSDWNEEGVEYRRVFYYIFKRI
jgi:phosphoketolase